MIKIELRYIHFKHKNVFRFFHILSTSLRLTYILYSDIICGREYESGLPDTMSKNTRSRHLDLWVTLSTLFSMMYLKKIRYSQYPSG